MVIRTDFSFLVDVFLSILQTDIFFPIHLSIHSVDHISYEGLQESEQKPIPASQAKGSERLRTGGQSITWFHTFLTKHMSWRRTMWEMRGNTKKGQRQMSNDPRQKSQWSETTERHYVSEAIKHNDGSRIKGGHAIAGAVSDLVLQTKAACWLKNK